MVEAQAVEQRMEQVEVGAWVPQQQGQVEQQVVR